MHGFSFSSFHPVFWLAVSVLVLCGLGLAFWVPHIRGMGAIGVMYLLIGIGGISLLVVLALAALFWLFH